jgi:hypothetical protein
MVGWGGPLKTCVSGRNMEGRVIPYANELGSAYFDKNNPPIKPRFTPDL